MARKEITTPLDLNNMNNHNQNYKELYNEIQTTDKRLSENMWEEIKGANTMKMLEPVQTADQLPATAEDKSLITVIDEQRVYAYVNDEWQPFSEIDLDPFSPFKEELAEIVAAYEVKIQNITQEVQATKDSAIESIQSTQSQSESNINKTEQSAINSINGVQQEAESQIDETTEALKGKTEQLTSLFNDYLEQLTSNRDTTLAEVDNAKQEAISTLEDFQKTDTSNWQKYKLTTDEGAHDTISLADDYDKLHALEPGFHYTTSTPIDLPVTSTAGFTEVSIRSDYGNLKHIRFRPYNSNQEFVKRYYDEWNEWEPVDGTRVLLFEGSAKTTGEIIDLNTSYERFTELRMKLNRTGGNEIFSFDAESGVGISINYSNVYGNNSEGKLYEMTLDKKSPTELEITSQRSYTISKSASDDSGITILKVWGVT